MSGDVSVGTVKAHLELDDRFNAAAQRAIGNLTTIESQSARVGRTLTTHLSVPLVAAGGAALGLATKFESTMTKVETLADVSRQQVEAWKKEVVSMADSVGRGPGELAKGLLVVTSAGERGTAALSVLNEAAKASAIGLGATDVIARAVTGAMQAYSASGLDAATATRTMIATVVEGNVEADELAGTLGRVVGIAAQAGVSFQETGAFIATFTRLGVDAAEAVTALRGILSTTINPTKEAREALASLKDPVTGATYSIDALRDAIKTKGLTQALLDLYAMVGDNVDVLGAVIPNIRALSGFLGTAGSQGAQFAGIVERINKAANDANYTNEKFARTTQDLDWKWGQLKAKMESAAVSMGDQLVPAASTLVTDGLIPVAEKAAWAVREFDKLPDSAKSVTTGIIGLGVVAGPATWALGGLATAIRGVAAALVWLGGTAVMQSAIGITRLLTSGGAAGAPLVWLNVKAGIVEATTALGGFIAKLTPWTGWLLGIGALSAGMKGVLGEGGMGGLKMDIQSVLWNSKGSRFGTNLPTPSVSTSETFALPPDLAANASAAANAARKLSEEQQKLLDQYTGRGLLAQARDYEMILRSIGGASRLTAKDQQEFREVFEAVVQQYRLMGPAGTSVVAHYEKLAKTIPLASASFGSMLLQAPKVTGASEEMAAVMRGDVLPSYTKVSDAIDGMVERTRKHEEALKALHIISPKVVNDTKEQAKTLRSTEPDLETRSQLLGELSTALHELSQVSTGAAGTFVRSTANIVSSLNAMVKGADAFADSKNDWQSATTEAGKASAAVGMVTSAISAATAAFGGVMSIVGYFDSKARETRLKVEQTHAAVKQFISGQGGVDELDHKLALTGVSWDRWNSILAGTSGNVKGTQHILDRLSAALENLEKRQDAASRALDIMGGSVTKWLDPIQTAKDELDAAQKALDELVANRPDAGTGAIGRYNEQLADAQAKVDGLKGKLAEMTGDAQTRFDALGVHVTTTFAGLVHTTGDFYGSLEGVSPLLADLYKGQQTLGLNASGAVADLLKIAKVKDSYKGLLDPLYADTQAIRALQEAGVESSDSFSTLATDADRTFRAMVDGGVDSRQVMALMQPTLQTLWEQWKSGKLAVDDETEALLRQAEEHGLVGEDQKSINDQALGAFRELKESIDAMTLAITDWGKAAEEGFRRAAAGADYYGKAVPRGTPALPVGAPTPTAGGEQGGAPGARDVDTYHVGGLIRARHTGASYWAGGAAMAARIAHRGRYLKPGEVPVIAREYEGVLSADVGMPTLARSMGTSPEAALGMLNSGRGIGGGDTTQTINVYIEDELISRRAARGLQRELDIMVR